MTPEQKARIHIDTLLEQAGWAVQDAGSVKIHARRGVAIREFGMKTGHGTADYLLYVDQKAAGVVEAKPVGYTLKGVETQSGKYSDGLPDSLPAHRKPLPFLYETTGEVTHFTNLLDPQPTSRRVFSFHTPDVLAHWVGAGSPAASSAAGIAEPVSTYRVAQNLRQRLQDMPPLDAGELWPVQERAILNLEQSLAKGRPRALIQMATGSGKTFTACNLVYRLIKYAGAKRVLFLVDRNNLGRQTLREFQGFTTPEENRKFTELYNVQLLQSGHIDPVSRVSISTIQRVYSMLRGEDLDPEKDELSGFDFAQVNPQPGSVEYNPDIPIDTFDFIITDECHRSIYNLWRQVLEYFDAFLIGLTATPSAQTFGFFQQNLVMEYTHEEAVADKVNVDSDIYRIRTQITEDGSSVAAGQHIDRRNRKAKTTRWAEELDEDLTYTAGQLDREVVAEDQIRTVIRTFRDRLFTEIFPGRTEVPKTIIFAKDDSHAEDIVDIVRTEFGKGNDFCRKITYKEHAPEQLIAAFRNSYNPRIVVTVDMIATGTDIKPVEIVFFMRNVQSRNLFEQMKGRGVRVISPTEFNAVTPDAENKDRFVIIDAVGVTESELSDSYSLEREPTKTFGQLLDLIAKGSREPDHLSSLASRLARLSHKISPAERESIETAAEGVPLQALITNLVRGTDPDAALEAAREATGLQVPPPKAIAEAEKRLRDDAAKPFATNPELRQRLKTIHQSHEQTIDTVSKDVVLDAGFTEEAAQVEIQSFQQFIKENRDEITALQVLYEQPYRQRLRLDDIRALADAMEAPPRSWTTERLWQAYQRLDESKVRGSGQRQLADIVALVRYATGEADELAPFADHVIRRFEGWLAMQETAGREFTEEQRWWLEAIRDRIAGNVSAEMRDLQNSPLDQRGGLIAAYDLFGDDLQEIIDELNLELVS